VKPDFLVVGAARTGTTTLDSYLRQHPGIFLPKIKEPCFFVFDGEDKEYQKGKFAFAVRDFKSYGNLFREAKKSQITGEMSTPYLYLYDKTISSLQKYFPDFREIKIVMMLRNPVDRAFSQYCWRVRDGREPLSFAGAIEAEKERMLDNFSFDYFYLDRGFYFKQVKAYMENFHNVHVILFEDFQSNPFNVLQKLCKFLGVEENFEFTKLEAQNKSTGSRFNALGRAATMESNLKFKLWYSIPDSLRKRIRRWFTSANEGTKPVLDSSTQQILRGLYHEDILELQKLISRDLSSWL
jgi:hypothetical protein